MIGRSSNLMREIPARSVLVGVLALVVLPSCNGQDIGNGEADMLASTQQRVVYGVDNRQDVPEHSDASLRRLAEASALTLVRSWEIDESDPNNITFPVDTLGVEQDLCAGERFFDDPAAGWCSATLIADDLILTAGHCFRNYSCDQFRYVFNYRNDDGGGLHPITSEDVFECQSIVVREYDPADEHGVDYAIVRLDRSATPRFTPAPVRSQGTALENGQRVAVIGSPSGIPAKIDSGGAVRDARDGARDYFVATTDTFHGNSGSGVYETDSYQLAGILVRGDYDYRQPAGSDCQIVNVCAEDGCRGEDSTYVHRAIAGLCAVEPGHRLCNPRKEHVYSASGTSSAWLNTMNQFIFVEPGQTLDFGTCSVPGGSGSGDTLLRLFNNMGQEVAANDDGGNSCSVLSRATFTAPALTGGLYELRAGCYGSGACSGTVAETLNGPAGGKFTYDATNTDSANVNTRVVDTVSVRKGETLIVGTCGVEHASFSGDTYLRLYSGSTLVAYNDDGCESGHGSRLSYTASSSGVLQIRAGCWSTGSCSGTVAYTIVPGATFDYSASNTSSALQNTANRPIRLSAGDTITMGTCGIPGASNTGDTFVRLYMGSTEVAYNDDGCPGNGSLLTYTATQSSSFEVRAGCFSSNSCGGTLVYNIVRKGSGSGSFWYSASDTGSATQYTVNQPLTLRAGQVINLGTCGVSGASGTGDTYLRLYGPDSELAVANDDGCNGALSNILFTVPSGREGSYEIRGGCWSSGSCSGTVAYQEQ